MQTLHGIRFVPVARVSGTLFGLDARWLGTRGLVLSLLVVLFTSGGPLSPASELSIWGKTAVGVSSFLAVVLTSFFHELGHAVAGRLAGLPVFAIVLAPEGAVTIREASESPHVNFRTAMAGPLTNAFLGTACAALAQLVTPDSIAFSFFTTAAGVQLLTGMVNLLPLGPMDGTKLVAAWRGCRASAAAA